MLRLLWSSSSSELLFPHPLLQCLLLPASVHRTVERVQQSKYAGARGAGRGHSERDGVRPPSISLHSFKQPEGAHHRVDRPLCISLLPFPHDPSQDGVSAHGGVGRRTEKSSFEPAFAASILPHPDFLVNVVASSRSTVSPLRGSADSSVSYSASAEFPSDFQ